MFPRQQAGLHLQISGLNCANVIQTVQNHLTQSSAAGWISGSYMCCWVGL